MPDRDEEVKRLKRLLLVSWSLLLAVAVILLFVLSYTIKNVADDVSAQANFLGKTGDKVKQLEKKVNSIDSKMDSIDPKDGYTPIKGVDYSDGVDGRDGVDGKNGEDGKNGKDGKDAPPAREVEFCKFNNGKLGQRYKGTKLCTPIEVVDG